MLKDDCACWLCSESLTISEQVSLMAELTSVLHSSSADHATAASGLEQVFFCLIALADPLQEVTSS